MKLVQRDHVQQAWAMQTWHSQIKQVGSCCTQGQSSQLEGHQPCLSAVFSTTCIALMVQAA